MKNQIMKGWYNSKVCLPVQYREWCIVLTKNSDDEDFVFMAFYDQKTKSWDFFDDSFGEGMQVTFWMPIPPIPGTYDEWVSK